LPHRVLAREADGLESTVSELVSQAFELTPTVVRLMWDTAAPPMPIGLPAGVEK
jgi:hypothetical protein